MGRFFKGMITGAIVVVAGFCLVVMIVASNTGLSFNGVIHNWFPVKTDEQPADNPQTPVTEALAAYGLTLGG